MTYSKTTQTYKTPKDRKECSKCKKTRLIKFFSTPRARICNTCKAKAKKIKRRSSKRKSRLKAQLWEVMKTYIKQRDKMTCQWCGKKITSPHDAHTSHVKSKKLYPNLKFDPMNLKLLCYHCHIQKWHKDPDDAITWFKNKFFDRWQYIIANKDKVKKETESDIEKAIERYSKAC